MKSGRASICIDVTPFGYTDGADIISNEAISVEYLSVGVIFMIVGIAAAYLGYTKKDIG